MTVKKHLNIASMKSDSQSYCWLNIDPRIFILLYPSTLTKINSIRHISSTAPAFWVEKNTFGHPWFDEIKSFIFHVNFHCNTLMNTGRTDMCGPSYGFVFNRVLLIMNKHGDYRGGGDWGGYFIFMFSSQCQNTSLWLSARAILSTFNRKRQGRRL